MFDNFSQVFGTDKTAKHFIGISNGAIEGNQILADSNYNNYFSTATLVNGYGKFLGGTLYEDNNDSQRIMMGNQFVNSETNVYVIISSDDKKIVPPEWQLSYYSTLGNLNCEYVSVEEYQKFYANNKTYNFDAISFDKINFNKPIDDTFRFHPYDRVTTGLNGNKKDINVIFLDTSHHGNTIMPCILTSNDYYENVLNIN